MLESIINLISNDTVDSHTPQTAVAAVLYVATIGLFGRSSLFTPDTEKIVDLIRRNQRRIGR